MKRQLAQRSKPSTGELDGPVQAQEHKQTRKAKGTNFSGERRLSGPPGWRAFNAHLAEVPSPSPLPPPLLPSSAVELREVRESK